MNAGLDGQIRYTPAPRQKQGADPTGIDGGPAKRRRCAPALAFSQMRAHDSRSATRLLRTKIKRPLAYDRVTAGSSICGKTAAPPSPPNSMRLRYCRAADGGLLAERRAGCLGRNTKVNELRTRSTWPQTRTPRDGETRTRTGDTTIFRSRSVTDQLRKAWQIGEARALVRSLPIRTAEPRFGTGSSGPTCTRFVGAMGECSADGAHETEAATTSGRACPGAPRPVSDPWSVRAPKPARASMRSSSAAA